MKQVACPHMGGVAARPMCEQRAGRSHHEHEYHTAVTLSLSSSDTLPRPDQTFTDLLGHLGSRSRNSTEDTPLFPPTWHSLPSRKPLCDLSCPLLSLVTEGDCAMTWVVQSPGLQGMVWENSLSPHPPCPGHPQGLTEHARWAAFTNGKPYCLTRCSFCW